MRLALVLVVFAALPVLAQPDPLATVDSLARAAVAQHGLPSLVVGVTVGGVRTVRGYGAVGSAVPDGRTPYEIGSVTKVVTALALADAVTRGEAGLATPVQSLLPDSVRLAVSDRPITLADLATHAAGLPRLPVPFRPASILDPYADYTARDLMAFVHTVTPEAPGVAYAYSNVGVGLLAWLLARHDGQSVEAMLRARVLEPLGMNATSFVTPPGLAPPHTGAGTPIAPWTMTDALAGAGGLRSTADDLLALAEAAARPARVPALADAMHLALTPRFVSAGRFRVGLLWHLAPVEAGVVRVAWHNGATFGSAAFLGVVPTMDAGVVLLTNRSRPAELDALAGEILRAVGAGPAD